MHSEIIQLSPVPVGEDDLMRESDLYDDPTVAAHSEYFGDEIDAAGQERAMLCLSGLTGGRADVKNRTITFPDHAAVVALYKDWLSKAAAKELAKDNPDPDNLVKDRKVKLLIRVDSFDKSWGFSKGYVQTFAEFERDMVCGSIPRTMHFGAMLDYKC